MKKIFVFFRKLHDTSGLAIGDDDLLSNNSKEETEEEDDDFFEKSQFSNLSDSSYVSPCSSDFIRGKIVPQKSSLLSNAEKSPAGDHYLPQQVNHNPPTLPLAIQPHDWLRQNYFSLRWRFQQKNVVKD